MPNQVREVGSFASQPLVRLKEGSDLLVATKKKKSEDTTRDGDIKYCSKYAKISPLNAPLRTSRFVVVGHKSLTALVGPSTKANQAARYLSVLGVIGTSA